MSAHENFIAISIKKKKSVSIKNILGFYFTFFNDSYIKKTENTSLKQKPAINENKKNYRRYRNHYARATSTCDTRSNSNLERN